MLFLPLARVGWCCTSWVQILVCLNPYHSEESNRKRLVVWRSSIRQRMGSLSSKPSAMTLPTTEPVIISPPDLSGREPCMLPWTTWSEDGMITTMWMHLDLTHSSLIAIQCGLPLPWTVLSFLEILPKWLNQMMPFSPFSSVSPRRKTIQVYLGRLHLEICSFGWTDEALPQTHGGETVQMCRLWP